MAKGIPLLITIYTPFQGKKGQSLAEFSGRTKDPRHHPLSFWHSLMLKSWDEAVSTVKRIED
jgi:hypothetical protein